MAGQYKSVFKVLMTCHWFLTFQCHHTLINTPVIDKQSLIKFERKGHCLLSFDLNDALVHCVNTVVMD